MTDTNEAVPVNAASHTPGPWAVNYNGTIGHIKSTWPETSRGRTPTLAQFGLNCRADMIGDDEAMANAVLMAAAPDLLEAIKRIQHFITGGCDMPINRRLKCIEMECEASIAKATTLPIE